MNITKISRKIINYLIYAILILPAIVFIPWQMNAFELPKNVIFLILAAWLTLIFVVWQLACAQKINYTKNQKILIIALLSLITLKFISFLFSPNKDISFWGSYIRQDGLITHVFLVVWAVCLVSIISSRQQVQNYSLAISLNAGLISLYAVLQKFHLDFLSWEENAYIRTASTLGNPLFLSSFLILTLGFSVLCLMEQKNIKIKIVLILSIILQFLAFIFTASAGADLGLGLAIFLFIFIYFWPKNKTFSLTVAGIALASVLLIILVTANLVKWPLLNNTLSDFSINNPSNLQRLYVWQNAGQAFLIKPWFGWGNELFANAFDLVKNPKLLPPLESSFDRAHNIFLDIAATEGVFTLLAFVFILSFSVIIGLKKYYQQNDKLYLITTAILIGLIVELCFSFATLPTWILFYFVLAIIFFTPKEISDEKSAALPWTEIIIGLISVIILSWTFTRPIFAEYSFYKNLTETDGDKKNADIGQAIKYWPYKEYKVELYKIYQLIIAQITVKNKQFASEYQAAAQIIVDDLLEKYPNNYSIQMIAADFYRPISPERMNQYFEQALKLAPRRHNIYWYWGDEYVKLNQPALAIEKYQQAMEIDPTLPYPKEKLNLLCQQLKAGAKTEKEKALLIGCQ